MRKSIPILLMFLLILPAFLLAQQKYALVVGINKYYDKPGVLHYKLLHGCVNDAMSMKNLLLQQFGFDEKNIQTLLDAQATKENLVNAFTAILNRAQKGDAVVFYYSGHGAWLANRDQNKMDSLTKRGMNQAMVMSNLYAANLDALVRDADLKRIANKFVDKGIVFTMIADCCFSGMIVLAGLALVHNPYHYVEGYIEPGGKSMSVFEVYDLSQKNVIFNNAKDSTDEFYRVMESKLDADTALRSFNLKDALFIRDSAFITRPSERRHSMFALLSASEDIEPALEETDQTNTRHGVFTKTLIDVIKNNSPEMPLSELKRQITQTVRKQGIPQSPQYHEDKDRLTKNLIGIAPAGFRKHTVVSVTSVSGNKVILRGGLWTNLSVGNILSPINNRSKITLNIEHVFNDSSEAVLLNGNPSAVRPGERFEVTDNYTASAPLMKLFIGSRDFTPATFLDFMNKKILPLTRLPGYMSYEDWYAIPCWNINYSEAAPQAENNAEKILKTAAKDSFTVMLPIPSYIADPLKLAVQKNQNIQLVNSAAEADYVLYLNYVRGAHPHFVFTWNHLMSPDFSRKGQLMFINLNAKTKTPLLLEKDMEPVAAKLTATPNLLIRENSGHLLNFIPKRKEP